MTEQTSQTESTEGTTEQVESTALGGAHQQDDPNKQREGEDAAAFAERLKKQAEDDKGKGADKTDKEASAAPETYDLKAPEGVDFDKESFSAIEPTLRELGLSNDAAQKLVDAYAGNVMPALQKRLDDTLTQKAADQRKEWAEAFENDPDIGGAKKGDTLSAAARVFDHYGLKKGEGLRQLLDESGLGNHPDLIRVFARIGADMAEGEFQRGDATVHPKTAEQTLYGPEFQGKK